MRYAIRLGLLLTLTSKILCWSNRGRGRRHVTLNALARFGCVVKIESKCKTAMGTVPYIKRASTREMEKGAPLILFSGHVMTEEIPQAKRTHG